MMELAKRCSLRDGKLEMPQDWRGWMGFTRDLVRQKTKTKLDGTYTVRTR